MIPDSTAVLSQLFRLSSQPLLIRGDAASAHSARFAGLLRRALRGEPLAVAERADLYSPAAGTLKPWEAREQIRFCGPTAIIPVFGTLASGLDAMTAWWMDCCRYEAIQCAAEQLGDRPDVRTVILDVNSPGGYVTGCQETAALLAEHLADKLTVAWSGSEDCSAAYWLSCACSRMVCAPSATLANVGVMTVIYDYSKMYEEAGVGVKVYKTGAYKGAGVAGTSLTPEQETFIQQRIDDLGARFLSDVQAARPKASADDLQGQWWTGDQAVARHLADATALNLDELIETLAMI